MFRCAPGKKNKPFSSAGFDKCEKKHAHTTNEVAQVEEDERTAAAKAKKKSDFKKHASRKYELDG